MQGLVQDYGMSIVNALEVPVLNKAISIIAANGQAIDLIHKSHNAPVPYPTLHHSEQKCTHFCSEWCIVGYGTSAFWDLWDWSNDGAMPSAATILTHMPSLHYTLATAPQGLSSWFYVNVSAQDCSNSSVPVMELLQSCAKQ